MKPALIVVADDVTQVVPFSGSFARVVRDHKSEQMDPQDWLEPVYWRVIYGTAMGGSEMPRTDQDSRADLRDAELLQYLRDGRFETIVIPESETESLMSLFVAPAVACDLSDYTVSSTLIAVVKRVLNRSLTFRRASE